MDDDILNDISRIRRMVGDAAKDQDIGKDIGAQLGSISADLGRLLEKAEARQETLDRESLDQRTRFISDLAGSFLRTKMATPGTSLTDSEVQQSVELASEIVKRVKATM